MPMQVREGIAYTKKREGQGATVWLVQGVFEEMR